MRAESPFFHPGGPAAYRLPLDLEALVVAARPHLKPLFRSNAGKTQVLAMNRVDDVVPAAVLRF